MSIYSNELLCNLFDTDYNPEDYIGEPNVVPIQNYIVFDRTGIKHSEESKKKISDAQKISMLGNTNGRFTKGKTWKLSEESKLNISKGKTGKKRAPFSDEWKRKLSESRKKYLAKLKEGN
jgi:hypothetical protein